MFFLAIHLFKVVLTADWALLTLQMFQINSFNTVMLWSFCEEVSSMKNTKQIHSLQFKTAVKDMKKLDAFVFLHSLPLTPWVRHLT